MRTGLGNERRGWEEGEAGTTGGTSSERRAFTTSSRASRSSEQRRGWPCEARRETFRFVRATADLGRSSSSERLRKVGAVSARGQHNKARTRRAYSA